MMRQYLKWLKGYSAGIALMHAMVGLSGTLAKLLAIMVAVEAVALKCLIKVEGPGFESSLPASK